MALVVGAASFFGSHLIDKLLHKNLQVIGVDDLSYGARNNLSKASEGKDFHLIIDLVQNLNIELGRLDYIFIVPNPDIKINKFLDLFEKLKPRLLLISSIELYGQSSEDLNWLKRIETEVAKAAQESHLNARILRLGPIYGPRMNFGRDDPMGKLIQQTLSGDLQKDITLEFSSRSVYVEDAVNLAIKCIFAGATAQKIFDGVLPAPVKVSEIKQILLDPVWYESKQFSQAELPPWPTPNLDKTIRFLNWHPQTHLVSSLKETLAYFKDNEIKVPKLEDRVIKEEKAENGKWKMEKAGELQGLKNEPKEEKVKKGEKSTKFSTLTARFLSLLVVLFIMYALVWPFLQMGWGVLTFRFQLESAVKDLEKGQFENSLSAIKQANDGVLQAKGIFSSLEPIRQSGILKKQFEIGDNLTSLATLSTEAAQNTILGIQALYQSLKSITGEKGESPQSNFETASLYLTSADEQLSKAEALINDGDFKSSLPQFIRGRVDSLSERLSQYSNLIKKARALSFLLPEVVAIDGNKNYLVILQDNGQLRPTGGFIASLADISFENGKLKNLQAKDTYETDSQLNLHVESPKEIKKDLGQKDYFLRDSNFEPDFPTSARQAEWFYDKETSGRVSGVVALDISAIEDLLKVIGTLDLPDYNEKVTAQNLFAKSISYAQENFSSGNQTKKSFLTALVTSLFNKLFFLPNQNWPAIVGSLGKSVEGKHISIYLNDPTLFSYLVSQKWAGVLPRGSKDNESEDFLAPVEANLGGNYANYYLDRSYNLETVIGEDGQVSHRLRIVYTNRSPSDTFPGGKYRNRIRLYLPFGAKLTRALWAEKDITTDVSSFVDYGRTGFSALLELNPKEQKTLVLDYQTPVKLDFREEKSPADSPSKASYRLHLIKQAGTLNDPFEWNVTYPTDVKLASNQTQTLSPQQYSIKTDLTTDKSFQLEFSRP